MSTVISDHDKTGVTYGKYIAGFVSSLILTLVAYLLATHSSASRWLVVGLLAVLALTQFVVQMVLFLHVGSERWPRWKLGVFAMMLGFVLILVVGTIWVMNNLNYRMTPQQMQQYLKSQDSL